MGLFFKDSDSFLWRGRELLPVPQSGNSPRFPCRCYNQHISYTIERKKFYMKLKVNGTELYFDVVGSSLDPSNGYRQKPTLVILHGGPGFDHTYLRPWLDPVGEVAQLVYVDERGCGRSARHTHEYYQLGIMADDIVLLCQTLAIEHPIVLGQSFGGFVALSIATRHPDFAAGIILFDTSPSWSNGYDLDALEQIVGDKRGSEAARDLREIAYRESTGVATEAELKRFEEEI